MPSDTLNHLLNAGTAVISDVFDSFGEVPLSLDNSLHGVKTPGTKFAGPAYTVTGEAHEWKGGGDRMKLAAIDAMPKGVVALWASNDARGVCCFGDLLATAMEARGCAGVVVDGGVRDMAFLRNCDMPVVARYHTPSQAIGRWRVTASQVLVKVRGALRDWIAVNPGDILVADDDGVIVVPAASVDKFTEKVIEWANTETESREAIRNGMPLLAAIEKYGHL
jgi:4-hydroxy-4-methyl-2-oxoglutarate aldolase